MVIFKLMVIVVVKTIGVKSKLGSAVGVWWMVMTIRVMVAPMTLRRMFRARVSNQWGWGEGDECLQYPAPEDGHDEKFPLQPNLQLPENKDGNNDQKGIDNDADDVDKCPVAGPINTLVMIESPGVWYGALECDQED